MESPLIAGGMLILSAAIVLWSAGAIYFDVFGASPKGKLAAILWGLVWAAALYWWTPPWQPFAALVAVFFLFLRWWLSLEPSQDRDWDPNFARLATMELDGDLVTIANLRNSDYSARGETTPRFETRQYRLSELVGVDAAVTTWGSPWMSHPMFVFDFGPDGRVCLSIEVRYRTGMKFSLLRTLYRQQELMYVVSVERDAILRRTLWHKEHDVYLYRLWADDAIGLRQFFLGYANRVNALAKAPRWYHGLTTNCTTAIYAQGRGQFRWGWRMLVNGSLDRMMYERELLDQRFPFEELKRQSWINEIANRAPEEGFGEYVRGELQPYQRTERAVAAELEAS